MSNVDPNIDPNDVDDPNDSPVIKQLRQQARAQAAELKTLREQAEQAAAVAKENALYKANLQGLDEEQRQALIALVPEATPEAFTAKAQALKWIEPAAPAAPVEELAALDRIANAATGGTTPDPANYEAELAGARNEAEALAIMAKYGTPMFKGN